jgi:hypothetical protein
MVLSSIALYSSRVENLRRNSNYGPSDLTDYLGIWERAAKRIDDFDPNNREAYAVLRHLQAIDKFGVWSATLAEKISSEGKTEK